MAGETAKSCLRISPSTKKQNRALLGFACQGNVRLVVLRTRHGRILGRAVLRVLVRRERIVADSSTMPTAPPSTLTLLSDIFARSKKYQNDPDRFPLAAALANLELVEKEGGIVGNSSKLIVEEPVVWMERTYCDELRASVDNITHISNCLRATASSLAKEMRVPLLSIEDVEVTPLFFHWFLFSCNHFCFYPDFRKKWLP